MLAKAAKGTESLVKRFMQRRIQPFCLLVLIGRSGSGKTHLAKAAVRAARALAMPGWERGYWPGRVPSAAFCDWPAFADSDADGIARDLEESDFVALDDIGAEVDRFKSGKPAEILRRFLGLRANRFTVVTTNVPQANWSAKWDERVADRLCRSAFIVDLSAVPSFSSCNNPSSKTP